MCKMKTLWNFGLNLGTYGVATDQEIQQLCRDLDTTVYMQAISSYQDVLEWVAMCGDIEPGIYRVKDGVIEVLGEDDDYDIVLISNLRMVV